MIADHINCKTKRNRWADSAWKRFLAVAAVGIVAAFPMLGNAAPPKPRIPGIKVGKISTEVRTVVTTADGLPSDDVLSIAVLPNGQVYAGTAHGLARFDGHKWAAVSSVTDPVKLLVSYKGGALAASGSQILSLGEASPEPVAALPEGAREAHDLLALAGGKNVLLGTTSGLYIAGPQGFVPDADLNGRLGPERDVRQIAVAADGRVAVAAAAGLFMGSPGGTWIRLTPAVGPRSWRPRDVRGVAFDSRGWLWFASPQGIGSFDGRVWSLYTADEGLPYNDFTTAAAGENGAMWFGTSIGAIRFDGSHWNYRQGRRWLPDDKVRGIAVNEHGDAWFATSGGVGRIERRPMTLAEKAAFFEEQIDKYHRRTPHEYVLEVSLPQPGVIANPIQHDSDNDGLWTAMYGAGECFAYAATHDPQAKERARKAFEALRFLSLVTQGGEHPAPKGFPARSILPTSGPDPNKWDSVERDRQQQRGEPLWKVMSPRWPKSADGKWYWKTDTSSDELDGHYFMYALYYDLVAETDAERAAVKQVVSDVTGHLLDHDFNLIDHDGKPTRWARFGPKTLNQVDWATGRGLNSLSILSYLLVAEHVTGEPRFRTAFDHLVKDHGYLANIVFPKAEEGPGTGNQSDDEMAFMDYYDLFHYAKDPEVRRAANLSLRGYFTIEEPEDSPLFNYIFASCYDGFGRFRRATSPSILVDSLDFLKRFPLDRIEWGFKNSHRLDIVALPRSAGRRGAPVRGHLRNGKVLPIDERFIEHWNYDAWSLDGRGNGRNLADGAAFLLPYYMGRYLGFIIEESPPHSGTPVSSATR